MPVNTVQLFWSYEAVIVRLLSLYINAPVDGDDILSLLLPLAVMTAGRAQFTCSELFAVGVR